MRLVLYCGFILTLTLCGCFPYIDSYYQAVGPGIHVSPRGCRSAGKPLQYSTYKAEKLNISVASEARANPAGPGGRWVGSIIIYPEKGVEVQLANEDVTIQSSSAGRVTVPIEDLTNVPTGRIPTLTKFRGYTIGIFTLPNLEGDSFTLTLPNIVVDGNVVAIPPYHFKRESQPAIAAINC